MRARDAALILVFCFSAGVHCPAERLLYRSNPAGMRLERIAPYRADEYEWTLTVEKTGDMEVRRLRTHGAEVQRWETRKQEEKEYDHGTLTARRVYGAEGELMQEETYAGGVLVSRATARYSGGRLTGVRTVAADGTLLSLDEYLLASRGSLRMVRRTSPGAPPASSRYVGGRNGISEERDAVGDVSYVTRFDASSRAVEKEKWKDGDLVARQEFTFQPGSDVLTSSSEKNAAAGTTTLREYGEKGRLATESVQEGEKLLSRTDYSWDADGRNSGKRRRSPAGLEEWRYSYGPGGGLSQEEYLRRGTREKLTLYTSKDERTEELYRDGAIFLRVSYKGDAVVREEVFEGGRLVRTRSFP